MSPGRNSSVLGFGLRLSWFLAASSGCLAIRFSKSARGTLRPADPIWPALASSS